MSLNKAILIGFVGRDPDIIANVAKFPLATTEKGYERNNGDGTTTVLPDRTEWHNIVAWKGLSTLAEKWIRKGSMLYIEGKITTEKWEKNGVTNYKTMIVAERIDILSTPQRQEQAAPERNSTPPASNTPKVNERSDQQKPLFNDIPPAQPNGKEDDLPF